MPVSKVQFTVYIDGDAIGTEWANEYEWTADIASLREKIIDSVISELPQILQDTLHNSSVVYTVRITGVA